MTGPFAGEPEPQVEDAAQSHAATARLRAVHRAAAELRRGAPVLLLSELQGEPPLALMAAETASRRGLAEYLDMAIEAPVLLLSPIRAASILHRPVEQAGAPIALRLSPRLLAPETLQALADPTLDQTRPDVPEQVPCPTHASAGLGLVKLARLLPAALAAAAAPDGPARAASHGLLSVPAPDVSEARTGAATELSRVAEVEVPLEDAPDARVVAFRAQDSGADHLAIIVGHPEAIEAPLVRLHSECFTGDLLGSLRCDCGPQLRGAIRRMAREKAGVLLYLAQEGRGIGLVNKLRAYVLQDRGLDTLDANRALGWNADERSFLTAAVMLRALGVRRVRLLTNNPAKLAALAACGIDVAGRVPHAFAPNGVNDRYLATKARRFGHLFD